MRRAVIFDFDGVIAHSEPTHLCAVREVVEPLGIPLSRDLYYERYVHLPDRELLRRVTIDSGLSLSAVEFESLLTSKHAAFERLVTQGDAVHLYPGVLELVKGCAELVPIGLCTAAQRRTVHAILGNLNVLPLFGAITTADDVERSKPDPMPYLRSAELLGISPADCVAIEDTVGGLTSAKGAGCKTLAVGHTLPREKLTMADHFVDRIGDLTPERLLKL